MRTQVFVLIGLSAFVLKTDRARISSTDPGSFAPNLFATEAFSSVCNLKTLSSQTTLSRGDGSRRNPIDATTHEARGVCAICTRPQHGGDEKHVLNRGSICTAIVRVLTVHPLNLSVVLTLGFESTSTASVWFIISSTVAAGGMLPKCNSLCFDNVGE